MNGGDEWSWSRLGLFQCFPKAMGQHLFELDAMVPIFTNAPVRNGSTMTDEFCNAQKKAFEDFDHHQQKGGLKSMGETLKRGMVLSVSIWDDFATHMAWLDAAFPPGEDPEKRYGVLRGPCNATLDHPKFVRRDNSQGYVPGLGVGVICWFMSMCGRAVQAANRENTLPCLFEVKYYNIKYGEIGSTFDSGRRLDPLHV